MPLDPVKEVYSNIQLKTPFFIICKIKQLYDLNGAYLYAHGEQNRNVKEI